MRGGGNGEISAGRVALRERDLIYAQLRDVRGMIACMAAAGKIARRWIDAQEWALGRMHGLWARMGRGPATASHLATGLDGERAAYFELKRRGLRVVARRWTNARMRGDVDLIGWDGDRLCFVEVKTRTERDKSPAESRRG